MTIKEYANTYAAVIDIIADFVSSKEEPNHDIKAVYVQLIMNELKPLDVIQVPKMEDHNNAITR